SAHPAQVDVEDDAVGGIGRPLLEEFLGRRVPVAAETSEGQGAAECPAERRVVLDHYHEWRRGDGTTRRLGRIPAVCAHVPAAARAQRSLTNNAVEAQTVSNVPLR